MAAGREVIVGLRPEDVARPSEGLARLSGRAELVSPLGSETQLEVALGQGSVTLRVPKDWRVREGEALEFGVDPARLHAFDAATEQRIAP